MQDAVAVHRALLEHGVTHEVARLARPLQTADDLPEVLGLPASSCAVVRCVVTTAGPAGPGTAARVTVHAVVVPAGTQPSPEALRRVLRAEATREATSAEINEATDCPARLVTPVGLPAEVPVVIDSSLALEGTVWTPTGESGTAVGLHGASLRELARARVVDLGTCPRPAVIDLTGDRPDATGGGPAAIDLTDLGAPEAPGRAAGG